jgi:murein tripeptide amidase MpaA
MNFRRGSAGINSFLLSILIFLSNTSIAMSQHQRPTPPTDWRTHAEINDYHTTPSYDETIAYSRRLDQASPLIRYQSFGQSGEGRAMPLLIAATGDDFTPAAARKAKKPVILIQACIHSGESDGKDAGLALLRDIAVLKAYPHLLDHVVVLFIPIYNVDGHEWASPYNRINQDGPENMGWRATSTNQNLNRDYMKADTPETRAWLRLWNEWSPDLFIDCHVTDGADFRYNVTYQFEHHGNAEPVVTDWLTNALNKTIVPATEADGNLLSTYMEFRDNRDLTKGIDSFIATPRFSTGYVPLRNRPGILIETHMLKPYKPRVLGTYDLLLHTIEEVNRDPASLLKAVHQADVDVTAQGEKYDPSRQYPLRFKLTDKSVPYALKAVEYHTEQSDVSGALRVIYGTEPRDMTVPLYDEAVPSVSVAPPLAYIVPPQWREVIGVLETHGLKMERLTAPITIEVESYRFLDAKWAMSPFEGRLLASFKTEPIKETRTYPAGSVIVRMAQPSAHVAIHLLEPDGPDSFVTWGFFNAIFEQKEYGEAYVVEKLARDMMAKDPALKREFEERVAKDKDFAANPQARLNFFYRRSPYWDRRLNLYPVGRIVSTGNLPRPQ